MSPTPASGLGRRRATVLFVLVLIGAWLRPWTEAATATSVRLEWGPLRTGAVAAALLLVLGGLAVTALATESRTGLRRGVAMTDAALALFAAVLLGSAHDWMPGGAARAVMAPVFLPLALLAGLDAYRPRRPIALARGAAGLACAALFVLAGAWLPAGVALWLGVSPLLVLATDRAVPLLQLTATLAAFFAPHLNAALLGFEDSGIVFDGRYLWQVGALVLMVLALVGLAGRDAPR